VDLAAAAATSAHAAPAADFDARWSVGAFPPDAALTTAVIAGASLVSVLAGASFVSVLAGASFVSVLAGVSWANGAESPACCSGDRGGVCGGVCGVFAAGVWLACGGIGSWVTVSVTSPASAAAW
jgi:hypothetical protein